MRDNVNKCLKILLMLGNLFFLICGAALIGIGVWMTQDTQINKFLGIALSMSSQLTLAYVIIGVGVVIVLISFMGCAGACMENKCCLIIFFIIQMIIAVVLVAGVALAFVYKNQISQTAKTKMSTSLTKSYDVNNQIFDLWNNLQTTLECCAVRTGEFHLYGSTPWGASMQGNGEGSYQKLPKSCCKPNCCKNDITVCTAGSYDPSENPALNPEGCWNKITGIANKYTVPVLIALFVTLIVLLIGMIFSMIIICQLRRTEGYLA